MFLLIVASPLEKWGVKQSKLCRSANPHNSKSSQVKVIKKNYNNYTEIANGLICLFRS